MPTEPRYLPSPAGTGSESTADACSCKSHAHLHCEAQQRRRCRGCCDKRHQGKCEAPCDAARCTAGRVHPALAWVIPTARTHGVQALATGSRHNDAISPSAWHPACWLPKVLGTSSPQAPRAGRICATNRMGCVRAAAQLCRAEGRQSGRCNRQHGTLPPRHAQRDGASRGTGTRFASTSIIPFQRHRDSGTASSRSSVITDLLSMGRWLARCGWMDRRCSPWDQQHG